MLKNIGPCYKSIFYICVIILSLGVLSTCEPVLMTQDIGQQIFQQHKYFLIYVYEQATPNALEMFNQHCQQRQNCAILNTTVEEYESVRKFIGKKGKQFFLILNVPFQKKYVLEINFETMTKNDLEIFQKRHQQQTLEPFYASQPIPKENSQTCKELVGRSYSEFLKEPAVLKIVYTYTKHQACGGCIPLLKDFISLAQKMHNKDVLIFGYVDVYLNDIPKIPQPIVPHFYIYQGNQIVKEVDQANFQDLPQVIKKQVSRIMIDIQNNGEGDTESSSSSESHQYQL